MKHNTKMINDLLAAEKILRGYSGICGIDVKRIHLLDDTFFELFGAAEDLQFRVWTDDSLEYWVVREGVTFFCLVDNEMTEKDIWNLQLMGMMRDLEKYNDDFEDDVRKILEGKSHDDSRVPEAKES